MKAFLCVLGGLATLACTSLIAIWIYEPGASRDIMSNLWAMCVAWVWVGIYFKWNNR